MIMEISVLAFGQIADATGESNFKIHDVGDTDELIRLMDKKFPKMKSMEYSIAVNKKIIKENCLLAGSDTVALLPPFSGG